MTYPDNGPLCQITFVTAYMNIYETPFQNKDAEWRFRHFRKIAETGVQLSVICSPDCEQAIEHLAQEFPNIKIIKYMNLCDTWTYSVCKEVETRIGGESSIQLPNSRNIEKDTREYILLMNAKTEFLKIAIENNVWNSTYFAWIDFNIFHIFQGKENAEIAANILRKLSHRTFASSFLMMPGCWGKEYVHEEYLMNDICWRFCGGFFIGSADRIVELFDCVKTHFAGFLEKHRRLIWEVNFWAYLELHFGLSVVWYPGDHNLSILDFNVKHMSVKLAGLPSCEHIRYAYLDEGDYIPTSTSYIYYKGQHIINTRFVNYWLHPGGQYWIKDPDNYLRTRNFCSVLDAGSLLPFEFTEMKENAERMNLTCHGGSIYGLEDIRLYEYCGELRFIATSVNYSGVGHNRMICGKYDIENQEFVDCSVLLPPGTNRWLEKNWIPIVYEGYEGYEGYEVNVNEGNVKEGKEMFIYKWHPYQVGVLEPYFCEEKQTYVKELNIKIEWQHQTQMFSKIRGSTPFVDYIEGFIGVVHFSYESQNWCPRNYYHMLVLLDKKTLLPLKYSEYFYFNDTSIEFCIGFMIRENKYHFWLSNFDRDPELMKIDVPEIPLKFSFV